MKIFGPVPSRRLGKSIGVNNIPPKVCSFSCAYCQVGRAIEMTTDRREFYPAEELYKELQQKISNLGSDVSSVDYITLVADGEPTLDINLGKMINLFKQTGIKVAIITNSTLLKLKEVRDELMNADWVSVKVDAVSEEVWRKVDRPHYKLDLAQHLDGIRQFASEYKGILVTETMLIKGINDQENTVSETANFINTINPSIAYLGIPTRPPTESWAVAPDEQIINMAYQIFNSKGIKTEYLIGYEGNEFTFTGSPKDDILSITAVHPMREDAVIEFVKKSGSNFSIVDDLVKDNLLSCVEFQNHNFYTRKFKR